MAVSGSGKGIQIVVGADYNGRDLARAQRDLDKLKREAGMTNSAMSKFGSGLKSSVTPNFAAMGAAVAAVGVALAAFAVQLGVDAVQAAAEEEEAVLRLQKALENVGQGFAAPGVEEFIDKLQRASGVADDELRPALQTLVTATGDAAQAQDLLGIALDVSAATGKDLTAVSAALAKASNGSFTAINKLTNSAIDPSILKTRDLSLITGELARLYGGQAAANAETFAGKMRRIGIALDELKESFGEGFIEAFGVDVDNVMQILKDAEPAMRELGASVGDLTQTIVDSLPAISQSIGIIDKYVSGWVLLTDAADFAGSTWRKLYDVITSVDGAASDSTQALVKSQEDLSGADWHGPVSGMQVLSEEMNNMATAAQDAGDELADLKEILSQVDAAFAFRDAMEDAKVSVANYTGVLDEFFPEGRKTIDNLLGMMEAAGQAALGADTAREKMSFLEQALGPLGDALNNVEMSPSTRQMLLDAFAALTSGVGLSRDEVALLQAQVDALQSKTITITVQTVNAGSAGGQNYGGKDVPDGSGSAMGGLIRGAGTSTSDSIPRMLSNGEFVIRAASVRKFGAAFFRQLNNGAVPAELAMTSRGSGGGGGVYIDTINVASAPGERVAESLPRSLRRMAWLAGLGS